jgi:hypothetical protein
MWTDILRRDPACPYPDALPRRVRGSGHIDAAVTAALARLARKRQPLLSATVRERRLGGGGDRDGVRRGGGRVRCGRTHTGSPCPQTSVSG